MAERTKSGLPTRVAAAVSIAVVVSLVPTASRGVDPTTRQVATAVAAPPVVPEASRLVVNAPSMSHERLVRWAAGRFEDAGLSVPDLTVSFHESRDGCDGHRAAYWTGTGRISVCGLTDPSSVSARKTMLHEMGHAWLETNLDDESRQVFLAFRGLTTWDDPGAAWPERGFEQAADIIAWGLMDVDLWMATLPDSDRSSLSAAYRILTGRVPSQRTLAIQ